ncbi:MAG: hypothetical protein Q9226_007569 [Calogaya cf. arnoldii]
MNAGKSVCCDLSPPPSKGYKFWAANPAILITSLVSLMSMLFFRFPLFLPSRSECSTGNGEKERFANRYLGPLNGFKSVTARIHDLLYWTGIVCQVVSSLVSRLVSDEFDAILGRRRPGGTTREIDQTQAWEIISVLGAREPEILKQDYTSALATVEAALKFGNHTKTSVAQQMGRLIMFFGIMTRIAQGLIYWTLIASRVALTMSAKSPQEEFNTEYVVCNREIYRFTLRLAGREPEEDERHYTETLEMTRLAFNVVRQTLRSKHDDEPDGNESTDNNMPDQRMRSMLVQISNFLLMLKVLVGALKGEPLKTDFIMVMEGPSGTTQHVAGLDTQSSENVITRRKALASGHPIGPYKGPLLNGVGSSIRPVGVVRIKWSVSNFDDFWYETTFAVLEDDHCKDFNILLSKEEISKHRFLIRNPGVFLLSRRIQQRHIRRNL